MSVQDILSDRILLVFLGILFLYFTSHLVWLLRQSRTLEKRIQDFMDRDHHWRSSEENSSGESLSRAWTRYQQTFLGPQNKTEEEAEAYFTESAVVGGALNLRY